MNSDVEGRASWWLRDDLGKLITILGELGDGGRLLERPLVGGKWGWWPAYNEKLEGTLPIGGSKRGFGKTQGNVVFHASYEK